MPAKTKTSSDEPTAENNNIIDLRTCPECGEVTYNDPRNKTGEPDNWVDNVMCPCCLWHEEIEVEIEFY